LLQQPAQQEWTQIPTIRERYARRIGIVPIQIKEPVGVAALCALSAFASSQQHGVIQNIESREDESI